MNRRRTAVLAWTVLLTILLVGCSGYERVMPPPADYLIFAAEQTADVDGEGNENPDDGSDPNHDSNPGSGSVGITEPEQTSAVVDPLPDSDLPLESVPDPNEPAPTSENLDIWNYDASARSFYYPPSQGVIDTLLKYDAFAYGPLDEAKVYLSFNAGYEYNDGMSRILDTLSKYDVKALIFLDGAFIRTQNDLTRRIVEDGHTVGNHTMNHNDLTGLAADGEYWQIEAQIKEFEELYRSVVGEELTKVYRPPSSVWSERVLEVVRRLEYRTYLFSFTHRDWEVNNQPDVGQTLEQLKQQVFPGSLIMLHTVSETNVQLMDDFIQYVLSQGYSFGTLPFG